MGTDAKMARRFAAPYLSIAREYMASYRHDAWGPHEEWMDRWGTFPDAVQARRTAGRPIWERPA